MSGYTAPWAVSLPRVDAETGAEQHPPRRFGKLKYLLASDFLHCNYYRRNRYGFDRNHSGFHAAMWKVPHPDGWRAGLEEMSFLSEWARRFVRRAVSDSARSRVGSRAAEGFSTGDILREI